MKGNLEMLADSTSELIAAIQDGNVIAGMGTLNGNPCTCVECTTGEESDDGVSSVVYDSTSHTLFGVSRGSKDKIAALFAIVSAEAVDIRGDMTETSADPTDCNIIRGKVFDMLDNLPIDDESGLDPKGHPVQIMDPGTVGLIDRSFGGNRFEVFCERCEAGEDDGDTPFFSPENWLETEDEVNARPASISALVPVLDKDYVITELDRLLVKLVNKSGVRNILLDGPAGSGKSSCARALAAAINEPLHIFTCGGGMQRDELFKTIVPLPNGTTFNKDLLTLIAYKPAKAYEQITGLEKADATVQECISELLVRVGPQNVGFVDSAIVKAFRDGGVLEIQEPTMLKPGLLVAMNSILENGVIQTEDGEVIHRHPNCIVVFTTNLSYEGCQQMNQSVIDRMDVVINVPTPSTEELAERAMAAVGVENIPQWLKRELPAMAETCARIDENDNFEGTCGLRALIAWTRVSISVGDVYKASIYTVRNRATTDPDGREEVDRILRDCHMKL